MKKLLILFITVFLLGLSLVSAYDLEVTSLSTSGNLVADNDIVFDVRVRNNEGFYNASQSAITLYINVGEGSPIPFVLDADLASGAQRQITYTHQYATKGTYATQAYLLLPLTHNDTNITNNDKSLDVNITNSAPVIEAINSQSVVMGNTFTYQVVATDADEDLLTYSINSATLGNAISINNDGLITYQNANSPIAHSVTVMVSDGIENVTRTFTLTVRPDIPDVSFSQNNIEIGGSNQERGVNNVNAQFTVVNSGTQTLTGFEISDSISSDYEAIIAFDTNTPLASGDTRIGTVQINVPEDQDATRDEIGSITIIGYATTINVSETIDVFLETESMIQIDNLEIKTVNDDDSDVDDGDVVDFFKENDKVTLIVTVENLYDEDDDINRDLEDVIVEIKSSESDWFKDQTSDKVDIDPESKKDIELEFDINDDIDEDTTKITLRVYGDDGEYNFEHYEEWELTFEIDREKHEISIKSAEIKTSSYYGGTEDIQLISCRQRDASIEVEVKNTGLYNEDEVLIRVYSGSADLQFSKNFMDLDINDGEYETVTATFSIPEDLQVGNYYQYTVKAYYDNDDESDSQSYVVQYICDSNQVEDEEEEEEPVNSTPSTDTDLDNNLDMDELSNSLHSEPQGKFTAFRGTNTYIIVLAVIVVLLLGGIAYLGAVILPKK